MIIKINAATRLKATEVTAQTASARRLVNAIEISAAVKYGRPLTKELSNSPKKVEILRQLEEYAAKLNIVKYDTEDYEQNGWIEVRGLIKGGYPGDEWAFDVNVRTGKIQPDTQTKKKLKKLGG